MSTRIHKKIPLSPPLLSVSESITRVPLEGNVVIKSRNPMILCFLAGEALLSINGAAPLRVGEDSVAISPGYGSRVYSSSGGAAAPLHVYGISFARTPPRGGRTLAPHERELRNLIQQAFTKPAIFGAGASAPLRHRLLALRHAFDDRAPGAAVRLYTATLDICVETARLVLTHASPQESGPGRRKGRSLVNSALEYMLRNLQHNPGVESIAWSVKVTAEHLCRVFRKELGMTPRTALRNLQIDTAKSLLINSPIEIHRVAEQSGFSSVTAFGRYFKAAVGVTPTEYRTAQAGSFVRPSSLKFKAG